MEGDLEEEKHCCRVCSKTFTNARSLGGHMRSHLSSDSSFDAPDDDKAGYGLRESPRRSWSESEIECAVLSRKRNKLRSVADMCDDDSSVYVPGSETEKENGAMTLMMLSRDLNSFNKSNVEYGSCQLEKRGSYKCRTCNRVFNSYQALGGHRASHNADRNLGVREVKRSKQRSKDHQCPVCGKVFASGQALGGHKRSHWAASSENNSVGLHFRDFNDDEDIDLLI